MKNPLNNNFETHLFNKLSREQLEEIAKSPEAYSKEEVRISKLILSLRQVSSNEVDSLKLFVSDELKRKRRIKILFGVLFFFLATIGFLAWHFGFFK